MAEPIRDLFSVADEQAALGAARYRAKRWLLHRAFWLFWLLPATNVVTAFVFGMLPRAIAANDVEVHVPLTLGAWESVIGALLCLQLAIIALGLVVKVMIANPPGGRHDG